MDLLSDFLKMVIPSALVLYAMYLVVRTLASREYDRKLVELKVKEKETVLPLRLQAFERVILFLERNSIPNLISRENQPGIKAAQLYHKLTSSIRDEFNHNLSQQLYISEKSWDAVVQAKDQSISIINQFYAKVDPNSDGKELSKTLIDWLIKGNEDPHKRAIHLVKKEIRELY